jgi:hypothetical protein
MLLSDWCAQKGRGAILKLSFDARLAYTTVHSAAQGYPTSRRVAEIIHEATGGEVERDSLILGTRPPKQKKPRRRREQGREASQ